jgi:hypothetical protein
MKLNFETTHSYKTLLAVPIQGVVDKQLFVVMCYSTIPSGDSNTYIDFAVLDVADYSVTFSKPVTNRIIR